MASLAARGLEVRQLKLHGVLSFAKTSGLHFVIRLTEAVATGSARSCYLPEYRENLAWSTTAIPGDGAHDTVNDLQTTIGDA